MNSDTSTNSPTRSSVQVSSLRCGIDGALLFIAFQTTLHSHQKSLQIWIFCRNQFLRTSLKKNIAIAQHCKTCGRLAVWSFAAPLFTIGDNLVAGRIEVKIGQRKSILQPVCSQ